MALKMEGDHKPRKVGDPYIWEKARKTDTPLRPSERYTTLRSP